MSVMSELSDVKKREVEVARILDRVSVMLMKSAENSGIRPEEVAESLGVSVERVHEIIDPESNIRLTSLVRMMYSLGYTIEINPVLRED